MPCGRGAHRAVRLLRAPTLIARWAAERLPGSSVAAALSAALAAALTASPATAQPAPDTVPYIPTPMAVVEEMLGLARVGSDDVLYDLGSGDGRIVIAAAVRTGARGVGFEIDPALVVRSRAAAEEAGVEALVEFVARDLFLADLRAATVLTLYLSPELNLRLRPKLLKELAPGTRVVSHAFHMGDWAPDSVVHIGSGAGRATAYLWIVPRSLDGFWDMEMETEDGPLGYVLELRQRHQLLSGALRRDGVEVAALSGTVRGDLVRMQLRSTAGEGFPSGPLIGRFRDGSLRGTGRAGSDGRPHGWRAAPFTVP